MVKRQTGKLASTRMPRCFMLLCNLLMVVLPWSGDSDCAFRRLCHSHACSRTDWYTRMNTSAAGTARLHGNDGKSTHLWFQQTVLPRWKQRQRPRPETKDGSVFTIIRAEYFVLIAIRNLALAHRARFTIQPLLLAPQTCVFNVKLKQWSRTVSPKENSKSSSSAPLESECTIESKTLLVLNKRRNIIAYAGARSVKNLTFVSSEYFWGVGAG